MRVVSGTVGGRRLTVPRGTATRPTSELARAAIFNSLEAQGMVEEATVVDLFAGSGALGIEALSRGAAQAVFVESDRPTVRVIERNLADLGLAGCAVVEADDVLRWAARHRGAVDIALVDPPYEWDGWEGLLGALATFPVGVVVAESDRPVGAAGWQAGAVKRHGGTVVTQLRPRGATHR